MFYQYSIVRIVLYLQKFFATNNFPKSLCEKLILRVKGTYLL